MSVIRVSVVGAAGYSGAEAVRLLARHPHAEIAGLFGSPGGKGAAFAELHPDLAGVEGPAVVPPLPDLRDRRPAALLEEPEAPLRVLDLEDDGPDAVGVLAEPAPGAAAGAERLRHEDRDVAGAEEGRPLPPLLLDLGAARRHLREVEPLGVEAPAPLQVVHVVVEGLDPDDAERLGLRGHGGLLSGGGASGWRSGCAVWNAASAAHASSIRRRVG